MDSCAKVDKILQPIAVENLVPSARHHWSSKWSWTQTKQFLQWWASVITSVGVAAAL